MIGIIWTIDCAKNQPPHFGLTKIGDPSDIAADAKEEQQHEFEDDGGDSCHHLENNQGQDNTAHQDENLIHIGHALSFHTREQELREVFGKTNARGFLNTTNKHPNRISFGDISENTSASSSWMEQIDLINS